VTASLWIAPCTLRLTDGSFAALSFAQFEREVIGYVSRDKKLSSRRKRPGRRGAGTETRPAARVG